MGLGGTAVLTHSFLSSCPIWANSFSSPFRYNLNGQGKGCRNLHGSKRDSLLWTARSALLGHAPPIFFKHPTLRLRNRSFTERRRIRQHTYTPYIQHRSQSLLPCCLGRWSGFPFVVTFTGERTIYCSPALFSFMTQEVNIVTLLVTGQVMATVTVQELLLENRGVLLSQDNRWNNSGTSSVDIPVGPLRTLRRNESICHSAPCQLNPVELK